MGSSRKLFPASGIFFVVLFLLSSQVAPSKDDQTIEYIDKKNGKGVVHVRSSSGRVQAGYISHGLRPGSISECALHPNRPCLIPPLPPRRRCNYANHCSSSPPAGQAGEVTVDQFKDDFHN